MTEHRIRLPWTKPPISANDRLHHMAKARIVRDIRATVRQAIAFTTYTDTPWPVLAPHVTVGLDYWPRDNRVRDADNLVVPFMKAAVDGMTDAAVTETDGPAHVTRTMPVIHHADGDPRLELWIVTE